MLPSISIIIPYVEANALFKIAVEACLHLDYPHELTEIILVYNGRDNMHIPPFFENRGTVLRLIREDNINPYAARNAAAKMAKGELLLFTDSDCIVDKDWAMRLALPFKDNAIAAVVGNVLAYNPQTPLELFGDWHIFNRKKRPFEYIICGNSAIRKKVFEKLGGFDEDFISGGDIDFSLRLTPKNGNIFYEPAAVVYHKHRHTLRQLFRQYKKYGGGWFLLKKKWKDELRIYPQWKRILIFIVYLFFTVFDLFLYGLGQNTIENKAKRFRHLYIAVINLALTVGFYEKKYGN